MSSIVEMGPKVKWWKQANSGDRLIYLNTLGLNTEDFKNFLLELYETHKEHPSTLKHKYCLFFNNITYAIP